MRWIAGIVVGSVLGLVYFGGLWLTVRGVLVRSWRASWMPLSWAARSILIALGLVILSRQGLTGILAGLGGLWLSRWFLLRELGGVGYGG
jgi:F1F0 ATPase subunit 2